MKELINKCLLAVKHCDPFGLKSQLIFLEKQLTSLNKYYNDISSTFSEANISDFTIKANSLLEKIEADRDKIEIKRSLESLTAAIHTLRGTSPQKVDLP